MTRAEYLQVLEGLEAGLRRHSDIAGNLLPLAQHVPALREAWERTAAAFRVDYPDEPRPVPFWERGEPLLGLIHIRFGGLGPMRPLVLALLGLKDGPSS